MKLGQRIPNKAKGFTLIELMVTVVIVAILLTLALPAYRQQVINAKRSVAVSELLTVLARQEQFFVHNKRYAASLEQLGYAASPFALAPDGREVPLSSLGRIYLVSISDAIPADAPLAFTLNATPQLGQLNDTQCGELNITSLSVRSSTAGAVSDCW